MSKKKIVSIPLLTSAFVLGTFLSNSYAVPVNVPEAAISPPSKAVSPDKSQSDTQMWNLQNADISAVIQTISQLTHKNFIIDPRVQGKVTLVSSKPMTVDEMYNVFLSMLQVLNYSAIPSGNVIKIVPSMDAKGYGGTLMTGKQTGTGDQVVVRVIPVNNVSATQLVSILRPLMLDWGSVNAYQPSNSLVLSGAASNINQLVTIVHNLDHNNGSTAQVVHLKYADATKLAQVIQSLQSADSNQGKVDNVGVVADAQSNALLLSGNDTNRARAFKLIQQLDTPNSAGGNNTAVIHLNYLTAKTLAPMLTKLAHGFVEQKKMNGGAPANTYGVGSSNNSDSSVSIQPIADDNVIVMNGPHDVIQSLKNVIAKVDTRPQEVLVQAIIVNIDESEASQLGIQWGVGGAAAASTLGQAFQDGMGFIHNGSFSAVITALKNSGKTDILATPSILVLNNQKAVISNGENVGIFNRQYAASTSTATTPGTTPSDSTVPFNTYDRQDVTLSLAVKPQIAPDNTVKLTIQHKDDSLAQNAKNDPGNPTINTSKINTTVLVNSGDILVLGGLISNNNTSGDQKIPLLGDIPILGQLFHYKTHNFDKKNLMVFIRPIIINNKAEAKQQSMQQYNYARYQQMRTKTGLGLSQADSNPVLPYQGSQSEADLPPPF